MRRILRASSLMGGASALSIAAGVGRAKALALLVGAEGIGLFGLFQSFQGFAGALAGLGLPASGVREVALAAAGSEPGRLRALKTALLRLPLVSGVALIALCWLGRDRLATWLFDDAAHAAAVLPLAIGTAALTLSLCQTAWINGHRKIALLARLRVLGAAAGAALTVLLVWRFGSVAIAWSVAGTSVVALLLTSWAWRDSVRADPARAAGERPRATRRLLRLGLPLMLAGLLTPATHLAVRALVLRRLGAPSLGHWQAAWSLSMIYVGFVLAAMAVDYVPRLSAASADPGKMVRLVNQQTRAALLLACPVILAMLAAAPAVVRLLYSPAFEPAVSVLSWQLVGDFFKVPAWALVNVFAAAGRGGAHLAAEALWNVPYLALIFFGVERFGLPFCGVAFLIAYALYFFGLWIANRRVIGFVWSPGTLWLIAAGVAAAVAVRALAGQGVAGIAGQAAIVLAFALFSFYRIRQEMALANDA